MFSNVITLLSLAASVSAHMRMEYPVPYAFNTLDQAPLAPGDFPCKQRPNMYDVTTMNQWNAGETKSVSFLGSAVHGGGSCQFSVTSDPKPSASTQWKVIQSVIGGCPSNVTGNLPANPDGKGAATFPVTMPKDLPSGQYTFAWTWLNKVGNREFYMNCAPIQVGSSAGTASTSSASQALSALPDMFVANLPATDCSTKEEQDFVYPNPGSNAVTGSMATTGNTLLGSGCAKQNLLGAGNGQIGSPAAGSPAAKSPVAGSPSSPSVTTAPKQPAAPSAATPSAAPSNPGGVFAPIPAPAAPQPTTLVAQPAPSKAPAAAPQQSQAPSGNNSGTVSADCTPCTNDGAVVCIGTKQFGLCNRGCAVAQDVALGMMCSNGAVVGATKRSHFPRAHIHRRHSGSRL